MYNIVKSSPTVEKYNFLSRRLLLGFTYEDPRVYLYCCNIILCLYYRHSYREASQKAIEHLSQNAFFYDQTYRFEYNT